MATIDFGFDVQHDGHDYHVEGEVAAWNVDDWRVSKVTLVEVYDDEGNVKELDGWRDNVSLWTGLVVNEMEDGWVGDELAKLDEAAEDAYWDAKMEDRRGM